MKLFYVNCNLFLRVIKKIYRHHIQYFYKFVENNLNEMLIEEVFIGQMFIYNYYYIYKDMWLNCFLINFTLFFLTKQMGKINPSKKKKGKIHYCTMARLLSLNKIKKSKGGFLLFFS